MDNKDFDVEKALDELFDGDFIDKDDKVVVENTNVYSSSEEKNIVFMDFEPTIDNNKKDNMLNENNTYKDEVVFDMNNLDKLLENKNLEDTIIPDSIRTIEETIVPETVKPIEEKKDDVVTVTNNLENNDEAIFPYEKVKSEEYIEKKKNTPEILKIILIGIIVIILVLSVIGIIIKVTTPGTIKCTYKADTDEFTLSDEYEIDYKSKDILSVVGEYKYRSKTEDFNKEIQFIKDEKIPVIVNSNGMPGFTYIYEVEDEIIKVYTYLDFTMFDYDEISKVNQKTTPISYFDIKKNMKIKDLKEILENKGYICK